MMALYFYPNPGMLLMCDFGTGFRVPEMVKKRLVVVLSPRLRRTSGLCTVVPLSTTFPNPVERFHHRMSEQSLPGKFATRITWAKCDMVTTVSLERLDRVLIGRNAVGKRTYVAQRVTGEDLAAIRQCVRFTLGLAD